MRPWTLIFVIPVSLVPIVVWWIVTPRTARAARSVGAQCVMLAVVAGWAWIQTRRARAHPSDLIGPPFPRPSTWAEILLVLPIGGLAISLFWLTYSPMTLLGLDMDPARLDVLRYSGERAGFWRVVEVVSIVAAAPILEEWIYRGLLLRAWGRRFGLRKSLIYTSLLFGFGHSNPLGVAVAGLVLGIVCVTSRSLLVPVGMHALNNAIGVLSWRSAGHANVQWMDPGSWRVAIPVGVVSAGLLVIWLREGAWKRLRREADRFPRLEASA